MFDDTSYICVNCKKSLTLDECYPEKSRNVAEEADEMFCENCFKKNNAILNAVNLKSVQDKLDKLNQLPARGKRTKADAEGKRQRPMQKVGKGRVG